MAKHCCLQQGEPMGHPLLSTTAWTHDTPAAVYHTGTQSTPTPGSHRDRSWQKHCCLAINRTHGSILLSIHRRDSWHTHYCLLQTELMAHPLLSTHRGDLWHINCCLPNRDSCKHTAVHTQGIHGTNSTVYHRWDSWHNNFSTHRGDICHTQFFLPTEETHGTYTDV